MRHRLALAGLAATAYALAAWAVAPGFYDGAAPQSPYHWLSPPPVARNGNQPPEAGSRTVKQGRNGVMDPDTAFTSDGQASLSFVPGSFDPNPGGVTIEIRPEATYPDLGALKCATNVYLITATEPLIKEALVTLRYSDLVPAPSDIYSAPAEGGAWTKLGSTGQAAPFNISARTTRLGYFVACYPPGSNLASGPRIGGGQTLPILVAVAIVLVVLAGIPLALIRRRGGTEEEQDET